MRNKQKATADYRPTASYTIDFPQNAYQGLHCVFPQ